jgi:5-methylcytosine-specific restriction endonuclease McrA
MRDESSTPTKTCTKCGIEKPATTEFFYPRRDRPCGLVTECKSCACERRREWVAIHHDEVCAKLRAYGSSHKEEKRAYRDAHREQEKAAWDTYYAANREQRREHCRQYHLTHREERAAYAAAYNAEHRAERTAHNAEHHAERAAWSRNRRARIAESPGTHTVEDVLAQYDRQHGKCYWCQGPVGRHYEVDHVMPLALGGSNGPENLVISCTHCNRSKGTKLPHEFSDRLC